MVISLWLIYMPFNVHLSIRVFPFFPHTFSPKGERSDVEAKAIDGSLLWAVLSSFYSALNGFPFTLMTLDYECFHCASNDTKTEKLHPEQEWKKIWRTKCWSWMEFYSRFFVCAIHTRKHGIWNVKCHCVYSSFAFYENCMNCSLQSARKWLKNGFWN